MEEFNRVNAFFTSAILFTLFGMTVLPCVLARIQLLNEHFFHCSRNQSCDKLHMLEIEMINFHAYAKNSCDDARSGALFKSFIGSSVK